VARRQDPQIRDFILRNVEENPNSITSLASKKFGLTRAGIGRYVDRIIEEGLLTGEGKTRSRRYKLKPLVYFILPLQRGVAPPWTEDTVWREHILPLITNVPQNVIDICQYGFTEMLNNVIDHSQSPDATVCYTQTYTRITMQVLDSGIGIFNKIQRDFHLADARTALLELSKGKITSDKRRHSGEGIYFTSRMFDRFSILSGHLYYARQRRDEDDWLIETADEKDEQKGTFVIMEIRTNASWTMREVFNRYQGENIYFRKTHVPVALGRYPGEQLVSRSQAKRILARFTDFSEVMLDFSGVTDIGQPFADEVFRVFKNEHPQVKLFTFNTNKNIDKMIKYVQSENATLPLPLPGPKPPAS
jgi:anti-sigma regulatory factor (Ser/Thr protein kinase)